MTPFSAWLAASICMRMAEIAAFDASYWACAAAIVRPDHYVYGVAGSNAALDRQLKAMAKQLA